MAKVRLVDETTSGERRDAWALDVAEERLTLREVIRRRVFTEVAEFNAGRAQSGPALVRPGAAEWVHGGADKPRAGRLQPQRCFESALAAFARNGFLVLVGDRQVTELDEELDLATAAEVTFLKLVPLVGG
ncbi:hypothetical protein ACSNOH_16305 [Streptomyces sp. URMC 127]|uniref:hypothetical protein n=1 Tax=Streptomyces sp. URMC 127 TaxID=3423402 RepID=UPI003F1D1FA9